MFTCFKQDSVQSNVDFEAVVHATFCDLRFAAYVIFQLESCPDTGRVHAQGYLQLKNAKSLGGLKKIDGTAHFEMRRGTHLEAKEYCRKESSRLRPFVEFGKERNDQGMRSDLMELKVMLDENRSLGYISQHAFKDYLKYRRVCQDYRLDNACPRDFPTQTTVLFGESGAGKSMLAQSMANELAGGPENVFWMSRPNSDRAFWDGYHSHDVVVIDEFYGWLPYQFMLRACDRFPMRVETKGTFVNFVPKHIIITSNACPVTWWKRGLQAMRRRLEEPNGRVYQMYNDQTYEKHEYRLPLDPPSRIRSRPNDLISDSEQDIFTQGSRRR